MVVALWHLDSIEPAIGNPVEIRIRQDLAIEMSPPGKGAENIVGGIHAVATEQLIRLSTDPGHDTQCRIRIRPYLVSHGQIFEIIILGALMHHVGKDLGGLPFARHPA